MAGNTVKGAVSCGGQLLQSVQLTGTSEAVAIGAASVQSLNVFATDIVRVISTVDCFIQIAASPTAAANSSPFLPAYVPEYLVVPRNALIAVIQSTTSGTLYVTQAALST